MKTPLKDGVLQIKKLNDLAELPVYMTDGSAGLDLSAAITEAITLGARERALVPTGLSMAIPTGYEGQIRPRSGLAAKHGVTVVNAPGTIDSDYRGEVMVALINLSDDDFSITPKMRIAQLVIAEVSQLKIEEVAALDITDRGEGGFGHTG